MNSMKLVAFLAALSVMPGCVIYDTDGTHAHPLGFSGDVTFTWSFAGATCVQMPEVRSVVIHIPGELLLNDGVFPCSTGGYPGITLHDFLPGTYSFSIGAYGYQQELLFGGAGTFTVDGDTRVTVDLTPPGGGTSYAYLTWRLPANSASPHPTCAQAGVAFVDVRYDGGAPVRYACDAGMVQPGVVTPYLSPGSHAIELVALTSGGYAMYSSTGTLTTTGGQAISAEYHLSWAVGGASLTWQLVYGSSVYSCASAGVQKVTVNFQDRNGNWLYGTSGDVQACDAAPIQYHYLPPGTYKVFIHATGSGGTYLSNATHPPVVEVRAATWPDYPLTVQLNKQ